MSGSAGPIFPICGHINISTSGLPLAIGCGSLCISTSFSGTSWGISGGTSGSYFGPFSDCYICKKGLTLLSGQNYVLVAGYPSRYFCYECAGYKREEFRFETREDWIRDTLPFSQDTPAEILSDWLEEQGRLKDAQYMRGIK